MNNQFDERLVSRMSEVFDNYEDNFADEGWKELRKKFPVKQQRNPLIYWIGSAAAAIILAAGIWIALPDGHTEDSYIAKVDERKDQVPEVDDVFPAPETLQKAGEHSPAPSSQPSAARIKERSRLAYSSIRAKNNTPALDSFEPFVPANDKSAQPTVAKATTKEIFASDAGNENIQVVSDASGSAVLAANTEPAADSKKRTFLEMASEEDRKRAEPGASEKKVTFGVYAGSFVSYAEGSNNKVNLGAGFTSDIALSKKLKISTGISIAQNTLSFAGSGDIPVMAQTNFKAAFAQAADASSFRQPLTYNLDKYDATLLGIDIPINLKYSLADDKRDVFVSAGFSSGAFINESYTYHYSSASAMGSSLPAGSTPEASIQNEDKMQKDFGNFDVARMLNLSFGIGYQVGKQQKLVIEPFVRYPLKDIGAENLRFGAGGVNLKLNFETRKK